VSSSLRSVEATRLVRDVAAIALGVHVLPAGRFGAFLCSFLIDKPVMTQAASRKSTGLCESGGIRAGQSDFAPCILG